MMNKYIRILLLCSIYMSCSSLQNNQNKTNINLETISKGSGSGNNGFEKTTVVIKSENQLNTYKSLLKGNKIAIDFSKEIVLLAIDRVHNTGGYSITITNAVVVDNIIEVEVMYASPKPTDMLTMAFSQPYHAVKIPKTSRKVTFKSSILN